VERLKKYNENNSERNYHAATITDLDDQRNNRNDHILRPNATPVQLSQQKPNIRVIKSVTFKKSFERKGTKNKDRMCNKCIRKKPDRTHHCSQCNECIIKMDHHCPWIANCVGLKNYKYFLLTLIYAAISLHIVNATYWRTVYHVLLSANVNGIFVYFILIVYAFSFILSILLTGFFSFHCWLINRAYTTIEYCEKKRENNTLY
jgi:hypothetical protein